MRFLSLIAIAVVLTDVTTLARELTPEDAMPVLAREAEEKAWSFSLSTAAYLLPDDREYVQPTFSADRGWLHLETRYNYESLDTASVWLGYNFSGGKKLEWEFTPMLGGVFGDTIGFAPGYRFSVAYWKIELSSEGEFVFDTRTSEGSFFYNWSELSISPVEWFRFGMVGQRTRAYQAGVDIQRGLLAGYSGKKVDVTAYAFNLDRGKPTVVFSVGLSF